MILNVKPVQRRASRVIPGDSAAPTPARRLHRRVVLLIDAAMAYGRGVLQGIAKYNREQGDWFNCIHPSLSAQHTRDGHIDGIMVAVEMSDIGRIVRQTGAAVLSLHPAHADGETHSSPDVPYVGVDEEQTVKLAAEHLIDRGVEHFAFCGGRRCGNPALTRRGELLREFIARAGHGECNLYPGAADNSEQAQQRLADWISQQPKPLGIMASNDRWGLRVLDACRLISAAVPDDVVVVGVDNDEALCDLAIPPLSSVDVNAEGIGYEAAALLDRMMSGEPFRQHSTRLAPRGIVARRSSDTIASEDEDVSRAVKFIRERASSAVGMQVEDVLGFTGLSRASLQQRMKKLLGHTIHQEIQRARLDRAKELLAMSEMTIKQVARESGFASVQYMTRVFRAGTGETPARYRSRRSV